MVLLSDPVDLNVPPVTELAVSLYLPGETGPPTMHATALHNTYISKEGDMTAQAEIAEPVTTQSYYWLAGIDVAATADADRQYRLGFVRQGSQRIGEASAAAPPTGAETL